MDDSAPTTEWPAMEWAAGDHVTPVDPDTPVEHRFLLRLRDNPDDLAMRMVFADWLEETAQAEKAETVRLLAEVPVEGSPQMTRLRLLGTTLDHEWMAIVSRAPIDKCPTTNMQFRYQCPKSWESLESNDDATIRFCKQCSKNVYFCSSLDEVRRHADAQRCVAFSPRLTRSEALRAYDDADFEAEAPTADLGIGEPSTQIAMGMIATTPILPIHGPRQDDLDEDTSEID